MLPKDAKKRKEVPIATGVLDYFPRAMAAIAQVSKIGNDQHNPGQPLHWDKSKSTDHSDCLIRHFLERGTLDSDGVSHTAKVAWRALALLETELEEAAKLEESKKEEKLEFYSKDLTIVRNRRLYVSDRRSVNLKYSPVRRINKYGHCTPGRRESDKNKLPWWCHPCIGEYGKWPHNPKGNGK